MGCCSEAALLSLMKLRWIKQVLYQSGWNRGSMLSSLSLDRDGGFFVFVKSLKGV